MTYEEAIMKWVIPACKRTWNEKKCNEIFEALGQEPKWISVSERLPNAHEEILATYEVEDGSRIAITEYGKYGFLVGNVTAWMPLPKSYEARPAGRERSE